MTALTSVLAVAGAVPQDPWPFVIIGYVVMALGLIAVAVQTVIRGRRLSQRVPADQRRWLDARVAGARPAGAGPAVARRAGAEPSKAGAMAPLPGAAPDSPDPTEP